MPAPPPSTPTTSPGSNDELLERLGTVVGDLEEPRTLDLRQSRKTAHDRVVDEGRNPVRIKVGVDVRIEDLEEVGKAGGRRVFAESRKASSEAMSAATSLVKVIE